MLRLVLPDIKKIEARAQSTPGCISFSQGALRVGGVHEQIHQHVQQLLNSDTVDYYSNVAGIHPLREKIAQKLSREHNITLTPQEILVSHGGIGAFAAFCLTVLEQGDEVLIPEPTYPVYANVIRTARATPVYVSAFVEVAQPDGQTRWKLDIDRIKEQATAHTKMVVYPNPSNPLGAVVERDAVAELVRWGTEKGIYIVSDEVYDEFIYDGNHGSIMPFIAESPFALRLGSFSKNYAMSGWRIGYIVGARDLYDAVLAVQDALLVCPSTIAQYAALYALDYPELIKSSVEKVLASKAIAQEMLKPLVEQGYISYAQPSGSFFLFLKTQQVDSTALATDILEQVKVALVPGKDFGPSGAPYMRLCFARDPELTREGLKRLQHYFGVTTVATSSLQHAAAF